MADAPPASSTVVVGGSVSKTEDEQEDTRVRRFTREKSVKNLVQIFQSKSLEAERPPEPKPAISTPTSGGSVQRLLQTFNAKTAEASKSTPDMVRQKSFTYGTKSAIVKRPILATSPSTKSSLASSTDSISPPRTYSKPVLSPPPNGASPKKSMTPNEESKILFPPQQPEESKSQNATDPETVLSTNSKPQTSVASDSLNDSNTASGQPVQATSDFVDRRSLSAPICKETIASVTEELSATVVATNQPASAEDCQQQLPPSSPQEQSSPQEETTNKVAEKTESMLASTESTDQSDTALTETQASESSTAEFSPADKNRVEKEQLQTQDSTSKVDKLSPASTPSSSASKQKRSKPKKSSSREHGTSPSGTPTKSSSKLTSESSDDETHPKRKRRGSDRATAAKKSAQNTPSPTQSEQPKSKSRRLSGTYHIKGNRDGPSPTAKSTRTRVPKTPSTTEESDTASSLLASSSSSKSARGDIKSILRKDADDNKHAKRTKLTVGFEEGAAGESEDADTVERHEIVKPKHAVIKPLNLPAIRDGNVDSDALSDSSSSELIELADKVKKTTYVESIVSPRLGVIKKRRRRRVCRSLTAPLSPRKLEEELRGVAIRKQKEAQESTTDFTESSEESSTEPHSPATEDPDDAANLTSIRVVKRRRGTETDEDLALAEAGKLSSAAVMRRISVSKGSAKRKSQTDEQGDVDFWSEPPSSEKNIIFESPEAMSTYNTGHEKARKGGQSMSIKAASLNKLIEHLTWPDYNEDDKLFAKIFLTCVDFITTPVHILEKLQQRFRVPRVKGMSDADWEREMQQPIQSRVCSVLKLWLDNFASQLTPQFIAKFEGFLKSDLSAKKYSPVLQILTRSLDERIKRDASEKHRLLPPMQPAVPSKRGFMAKSQSESTLVARKTQKIAHPIELLSNEEIARQITIMDHRIWCAIKPWEIVKHVWDDPDYSTENSALLELVSRFNKISNFVISTILHPPTPKERARIVVKWIKVAKCLRQLNNFNSLMAVSAGINHTCIARLGQTFSLVPRRVLKTLTRLDRLMSVKKNWKRYRDVIADVEGPCVPFLGLIVSDVVFVDEGNPDFIEGLINFSKMKQLYYNCIEPLLSNQTKKYEFSTQNLQVEKMLQQQKVLDANEIYQRSVALEVSSNTSLLPSTEHVMYGLGQQPPRTTSKRKKQIVDQATSTPTPTDEPASPKRTEKPDDKSRSKSSKKISTTKDEAAGAEKKEPRDTKEAKEPKEKREAKDTAETEEAKERVREKSLEKRARSPDSRKDRRKSRDGNTRHKTPEPANSRSSGKRKQTDKPNE